MCREHRLEDERHDHEVGLGYLKRTKDDGNSAGRNRWEDPIFQEAKSQDQPHRCQGSSQQRSMGKRAGHRKKSLPSRKVDWLLGRKEAEQNIRRAIRYAEPTIFLRNRQGPTAHNAIPRLWCHPPKPLADFLRAVRGWKEDRHDLGISLGTESFPFERHPPKG